MTCKWYEESKCGIKDHCANPCAPSVCVIRKSDIAFEERFEERQTYCKYYEPKYEDRITEIYTSTGNYKPGRGVYRNCDDPTKIARLNNNCDTLPRGTWEKLKISISTWKPPHIRSNSSCAASKEDIKRLEERIDKLEKKHKEHTHDLEDIVIEVTPGKPPYTCSKTEIKGIISKPK